MAANWTYEDLAETPPGPDLAATLAGVEPGEVPNDQILDLLRAQYRQLCHEQARTAAVRAEIGRCAATFAPGQVARLSAPNPFGPEETRAALAWTTTAAYTEHALADTTVNALTEFAWSLEQPEPGLFLWHSPLGGTYPGRGEFLDPPLIRHDEGPILPRRPDHSRDWRAPPDLGEDRPPF